MSAIIISNSVLRRRLRGKTRKEGICVIWTGATSKGYAVLRVGKTLKKVTRLLWEARKGPLRKGECVLHRCDRRACIRWTHFFKGTRAVNNEDKTQKGRQARGETFVSSKLTNTKVLRIRQLASLGKTHRDLADRFHVSYGNIGSIIRRETWKHV